MKLQAKSLKIVEDLDFKKDRYEILCESNCLPRYITVGLNDDLGLRNEVVKLTIKS